MVFEILRERENNSEIMTERERQKEREKEDELENEMVAFSSNANERG